MGGERGLPGRPCRSPMTTTPRSRPHPTADPPAAWAWPLADRNRLDFERDFLPDALARTADLGMLHADERRTLNQIRGHGYAYLLSLFERLVPPFLKREFQQPCGPAAAHPLTVRALACDALARSGRARRLRKAFVAGFGTRCDVIGPPTVISAAVLAHPPLAVALIVLHLQLLTTRHAREALRAGDELDPGFAGLLKQARPHGDRFSRGAHQLLKELHQRSDPADGAAAVDGYLQVCRILDAGLVQQASFAVDAFRRATRLRLDETAAQLLRRGQYAANRWTFLGAAMQHKRMAAAVEELAPGSSGKVRAFGSEPL